MFNTLAKKERIVFIDDHLYLGFTILKMKGRNDKYMIQYKNHLFYPVLFERTLLNHLLILLQIQGKRLGSSYCNPRVFKNTSLLQTWRLQSKMFWSFQRNIL